MSEGIRPFGDVAALRGILDDGMYQVFHFLFEASRRSNDDECERAAEDLEAARADIPVKLRALVYMGESRGLDMSPLVELGTRWIALCRHCGTPRSMCFRFRDFFDESETISVFTETTERLKTLVHLESSSAELGGTDGVHEVEQSGQAQLDRTQYEVLRILRDAATPMLQIEIRSELRQAQCAHAQTTVGPKMKDLQSRGYIETPNGPRSGYTLTPAGRVALTRIGDTEQA
ncbi:MAG: hypothetical protein ACF8PN_17575 [Phycisphaerales bacterium]